MLINHVSKQYHISTRTLRYYESIGLYSLSRNEKGIRIFSDSDISTLEEILLYKSIGLSLKSIKGVLTKTLSLKQVMLHKLSETDCEIKTLHYQKTLIESILKTYGSVDIKKHNLDAFLKEQIYLKDERWLQMTKQNITIDIGVNLIPLAIKENNPNILQGIQDLRLTFHEMYNNPFNLVRVKDNPDNLGENEFQILINDCIVYKTDIANLSSTQQCDLILSQLKAELLK